MHGCVVPMSKSRSKPLGSPRLRVNCAEFSRALATYEDRPCHHIERYSKNNLMMEILYFQSALAFIIYTKETLKVMSRES